MALWSYKMRDALSSEIGRVISDTMAIATKIGQQGNEEAALRILLVAELRLLRKHFTGTGQVVPRSKGPGQPWKVQPDMQIAQVAKD